MSRPHCTRWRSALPLLLLGMSVCVPLAAQEATVEQPTPAFGRTIGDVLTQRVPVRPGTDIDALLARVSETLPPGRIGAWLDRRPIRIGETRRGTPALLFEYQIANSPVEPLTVRLPPLSMGDELLDVAAWPVAVAPLTPQVIAGEGDLLALQPDRRLPPQPTEARQGRLLATGWALAVFALAWLLWWIWRERSERVRLPFARARQTLRRMPAARRNESPDAWTALHRALNDTAGGTVHRGSLDELVAMAPWLGESREAIARFFEASALRFFAQGSGGSEGGHDLRGRAQAAEQERRSTMDHADKGSGQGEFYAVDQLVQQLYRLEKQSSR